MAGGVLAVGLWFWTEQLTRFGALLLASTRDPAQERDPVQERARLVDHL